MKYIIVRIYKVVRLIENPLLTRFCSRLLLPSVALHLEVSSELTKVFRLSFLRNVSCGLLAPWQSVTHLNILRHPLLKDTHSLSFLLLP
jgi:hypothetical protein